MAERRVCMRVCKHGCDVKMLCFSRANHASMNLKKGFEFKTSISLRYLPISSSAETWKFFRKMLCQFFFAWAYILSEKNPYFGKHLCWKTRTDYAYKLRVQNFATGKNLCFNQYFKKESFAFLFGETYFIKAIENFFPLFAYPDI